MYLKHQNSQRAYFRVMFCIFDIKDRAGFYLNHNIIIGDIFYEI